MTLSTPSGRPASVRRSASARLVRGVCGAGLNTMVHPAAIAGPIFRAPMASGKFYGVISRQGPTGRQETNMRVLPSAVTPVLPSM